MPPRTPTPFTIAQLRAIMTTGLPFYQAQPSSPRVQGDPLPQAGSNPSLPSATSGKVKGEFAPSKQKRGSASLASRLAQQSIRRPAPPKA